MTVEVTACNFRCGDAAFAQSSSVAKRRAVGRVCSTAASWLHQPHACTCKHPNQSATEHIAAPVQQIAAQQQLPQQCAAVSRSMSSSQSSTDVNCRTLQYNSY